ncbi:MAG: NUDIX domain-containing protein [Candidatus Vogelbacteria bacterium]|nr:NUDIX domain-containing protein [Candidatus Vogelbacteria bacterium]
MPHIHELIDFTVAAYIVYQNKVLLCHHSKLDMWVPIGGHVELNEDTDEALLREIKEECGLEVEIVAEKPVWSSKSGEDATKSLFQPTFVNVHQISSTHRHIVLVYLARAKSDQAILEPQEHKQLRWFTAAELADAPLVESVRYYAGEALKTIKSSQLSQ